MTMSRTICRAAAVLPLVLVLACAAPSFGQAADGDTAAPTDAAAAGAKKPAFLSVPAMIGRALPALDVSTGEGTHLDASTLNGKAVLITYESRHAVTINDAVKKKLIAFCASDLKPGSWAIVAIVDASSSNWLTRGVWRRKLIENAKAEKMPIYGDWTGATRRLLGALSDDSTFIFADCAGTIRYCSHGRFDEKEAARQKEVLKSLCAGAIVKPRSATPAPNTSAGATPSAGGDEAGAPPDTGEADAP
jgi:hypothetical protein